MVKTAGTKKSKITSEAPDKKTGIFDLLRFGESYTSLILGIIVVIIATALLLSFVHNKNLGNKNTPISEQTQNTAIISQRALQLSQQAPKAIVDTAVTIVPTDTVAPTAVPTATPTIAPKPTAKPKPTIATKPTAKPVKHIVEKKKVVAKATPKAKPTHAQAKPAKKIAVISHVAKSKAKPQAKNNKKVTGNQKSTIWIVQKGESLWSIAEKKYTSGYNWVDIARANNLSNPSDIHAGDRLVLPTVPTKTPTIQTVVAKAPSKNTAVNKVSTNQNVPGTVTTMAPITGNSYTVVKGDNIWNIAVRAYGDGFRWVDIAKANNLSDPRVIHSGNVLTIPR